MEVPEVTERSHYGSEYSDNCFADLSCGIDLGDGAEMKVTLFILLLISTAANADFDPDKWGPLPPKAPQYAPVPDQFDPYDPQWRQWFAPGREIPGTPYRELEGSLRTMPELAQPRSPASSP